MKNFSETYYKNLLTAEQHQVNNKWFFHQIRISNLTRKKLYIPELNIVFNFNGEPENIKKYDYMVLDFVSKVA